MTTPTIGIACHSFRTDGGMGRYVQLLSEGLLNLGIRPTVITKKIDYSLPLSKEVSFHHINCKFHPNSETIITTTSLENFCNPPPLT